MAKDLKEFSTEVLQKREKAARIAVIIMGLCILGMLVSGVILTVRKGFSFESVLALFFIPIFIMNVTQLRAIRAELASRL
jgi:cytochrome b561